MAFQMDEVWVYQGQLKVNEPNNEPEWTKVTGENKINWATYLQGPVQVGDSGSYSGVEATLMVGPDTEGGSSKSLRVNGDVDIIGDTKQTGTVDATTFIGAHTSGSISTGVGGRSDGAKPFDMLHPSKEGYRLRYVCVEGPENGVYFRGKVRNKNVIYLPEYWEDLVDPTTITVQLQPIGAHQNVIVKRVEPTKIHLQAQGGMPINCYYHVFGERQDIERLVVEYEGTTPADYPGDNSKYQIAGYN
tara:strand:- start:190 stop:927 length:738 start_codon:yes stop_codon:yes gene_type:complete